jgi:beta-phosphoglucomutase-like phosphatase (HAD superfamily)
MGVSPDRCAVVEDTAVGVRAGVAAGMTGFGFARDGPAVAAELAAAGARPFSAMRQLPALLG